MKIWFLTRSYYPYLKGGGPLIKRGMAEALQTYGWDIHVVVPNYGSLETQRDENITRIGFSAKHIQKWASLLERMGIYEDYLDKWVDHALSELANQVQADDILLATSGGELGMIKLGALLKEKLGCKLVINFHDPLNYGYMNGLRRDKKFHIGREKLHKKYMDYGDLIVTSSQYYADVLRQKFPDLASKIVNNYFGYIHQLDIGQFPRKHTQTLKIAYIGTMSSTQQPELLYQAWKQLQDEEIEIYFIGDFKHYQPLQHIREKGVHFIEFMPHDQFLLFMREHIDVGFVSLVNDYFGACVPSKIYEYINLGIPILGALPLGDGREMINTNGYGVACDYRDITCLTQHILQLKEPKYRMQIEEKILHDRESWAMQQRIQEVDLLLRELI